MFEFPFLNLFFNTKSHSFLCYFMRNNWVEIQLNQMKLSVQNISSSWKKFLNTTRKCKWEFILVFNIFISSNLQIYCRKKENLWFFTWMLNYRFRIFFLLLQFVSEIIRNKKVSIAIIWSLINIEYDDVVVKYCSNTVKNSSKLPMKSFLNTFLYFFYVYSKKGLHFTTTLRFIVPPNGAVFTTSSWIHPTKLQRETCFKIIQHLIY